MCGDGELIGYPSIDDLWPLERLARLPLLEQVPVQQLWGHLLDEARATSFEELSAEDRKDWLKAGRLPSELPLEVAEARYMT